MKQQLTIFLIIISIVFYLPLQPVVQSQIISLNRLDEVEIVIYGQTQAQELVKRIEQLEQTLYGKKQSGSLVERVDNIVNCVISGKDNVSLVFLISTLEWYVSGEISRDTLLNRMDMLEEKIFDKTKNKPLLERVDYFKNIVLDDNEIPAEKVTLPAETPIRIKLLDRISSADAKAGDRIDFEVVNNIAIDDKLIIPEGAKGYFEVSNVQKAGNLGQDGSLKITLTDIITIDGTRIPLAFSEEDKDGRLSRGLALGAGLLGAMVLSNPLGLVIGYFVKGQDEVIPAGEEIYVKTAVTKEVTGLKTELQD